jgi:hypothetical protein
MLQLCTCTCLRFSLPSWQGGGHSPKYMSNPPGADMIATVFGKTGATDEVSMPENPRSDTVIPKLFRDMAGFAVYFVSDLH